MHASTRLRLSALIVLLCNGTLCLITIAWGCQPRRSLKCLCRRGFGIYASTAVAYSAYVPSADESAVQAVVTMPPRVPDMPTTPLTGYCVPAWLSVWTSMIHDR